MTLKKLVLITAGAMLLSGTAMAKNINVPGDYAKIADALGLEPYQLLINKPNWRNL